MTRDLETVLGAYVECALWSSLDYGDDPECEPTPFDDWASISDIAASTLDQMREDCAAMIAEAETIDGADWWDDEQLGHDFWLTRNGHGAGFWDRGQGDAGEKLTAAAKVYGEVDLYTADDGEVYAN